MLRTVPTKLHIPVLDPSLIMRPQVMRLLDQGLQRRLTLVAAPAGYGKTTNVATWANTLARDNATAPDVDRIQGACVAWYALDEEDDDTSIFFTRFIAAVDTVMPGALAGVATGLALERIAASEYAHLLADACLRLPHKMVFVLDDYHLLTAPDIHSTLAHLIQYAWQKVHLVIVTRYDPPFPIVRLRARGQVTEIRAEQLSLTEDETASFLETRLQHPLPPDMVNLLQVRTEGWIAGIQLAAVAVQGRNDVEKFITEFAQRDSLYVLDYFFDEVLDSAPAPIREFLLKTALLTRFNAELAAHITQTDVATARQQIDQLRRQNLFVVALDMECNWVRYHRQFRAMLLSRAQVMLPADTMESLRRDAAAWLVRHGWIDEALAQYIARKSWQNAADLIVADCHRLQNREEWHLLWRRLVQLPNDITSTRPALLLAQAWILQFQNRYSAIPSILDKVEALLAAEPGPSDAQDQMWAQVHVLRGSGLFPDTPLEERLTHLETALDLLSATEHAWIRGFTHIQLVFLRIGLGQTDVARVELRSEIDAHVWSMPAYSTRLYHALGVVEYIDGTLASLQEVATRYEQLAVENNMWLAFAWARYALSWVHYQQGKPERAWELLTPIFERPYDAHMQTIGAALWIKVSIAVPLGRQEQMVALLEQMARIAASRESTVVSGEITAQTALMAWSRGNIQDALDWVDRFFLSYTHALDEAKPHSGLLTQVLALGKIVLASGHASRIARSIDPLLTYTQTARADGANVYFVQGAVLLACCYHRTGRPNDARHWMCLAVDVGVPRGFRSVFLEQREDVAQILMAVQKDESTTAVNKLLRDCLAAPLPGALSSTHLPVVAYSEEEAGIEPLTEREIDILTLIANRLSNKEIARELGISPFTVRNHTTRIYGKLNVATRRQAVAQAQLLGLLPIP